MNGKALLVIGLAAGGAVLLMSKKAKAKSADADAPLPPSVRPDQATKPSSVVLPPIAPPLPGGFETLDPTGGVVLVPEEGEPEDSPAPAVVVPSAPPFVPGTVLAQQPPPAPSLPPDVLQTLPGLPLSVPDALQQGADILQQARIPVVVPPAILEPSSAPADIELPPLVVEVPAAAEQPTALHDDTAAVLGVMLAAESTSKWKRIEEALKPWQRTRGLVVDGKFGPKSATTMALETGLLPIIRYWPSGAQKATAVPAYRETLLSMAVTAPEPHASQLRAAAAREQGQGFGTNQQPISPLLAFANA